MARQDDGPNLYAIMAKQYEQDQEHDDPNHCAFTAQQYDQEKEHDDPEYNQLD